MPNALVTHEDIKLNQDKELLEQEKIIGLQAKQLTHQLQTLNYLKLY
jgi:hypothetical protein